MKILKHIKCYMVALVDYIRTGIYVPHVYEEVNSYKSIVIAKDDSFRTSDTYKHDFDETVHPDATVVELRCICCGHKYKFWYDMEPVILHTSMFNNR